MEQLLTMALGIECPIYIERAELIHNAKLQVCLNFYRGTKFDCPLCGVSNCSIHDTVYKTWRHLDFFQYPCYLSFPLPRIKCDKCGVNQYMPKWTRPGSGFTAMFEAFVVMLAKCGIPYSEMSRIVGERDKRLRRIVDYHVEKGYKEKDMSLVEKIGVDETSSKKGHNYVTVFTDQDTGKVIYVTEGKDSSTIERFANELGKHNGNAENVKEASIDMSAAFIKGFNEHLPGTEVTFDRFHVMKLLNEAVDQVRREEQKHNPLLKNSRYSWLKNRDNLTSAQLESLVKLEHENLETAKAYQLKCTFQDIYSSAKNAQEAELLLESWLELALKSNLEPLQGFVNTIKSHWVGVIRYWTSRLTSGVCEGTNSIIQEIKRVARGYKNMKNFINSIYLRTADIRLPRSPFTHSI